MISNCCEDRLSVVGDNDSEIHPVFGLDYCQGAKRARRIAMPIERVSKLRKDPFHKSLRGAVLYELPIGIFCSQSTTRSCSNLPQSLHSSLSSGLIDVR